MVLSFEMHCNVKIQGRIAEILEQEIGDMIYVIPDDWEKHTSFPSPEQLKNKFVIKGKGALKKSKSTVSLNDNEEGLDVEDSDVDEDDDETELLREESKDSPLKNNSGVKNSPAKEGSSQKSLTNTDLTKS